jgi:Outer membrane protein beta-barrel domain
VTLLRGFAGTEGKPRLRRCAAAAPKALALAVVLLLARPALAQTRFEIGASATWTAGYDAGGTDALLTRPSVGSPPLTLFATDSRVDAAPGVRAHAAWFVTRRVAVEGIVEYSRPKLRTTILDDFESATGTDAVGAINSYVFGGSVLYHFGGARLVPFVSAGVGAVRQLDEGQVNVITSVELHAGGGVKYCLSPHLALRGDLSVSSRDKSVAFEIKRRTLPVIAVGAAYGF